MASAFKEYIAKPRLVRARRLERKEIIRTYNAEKIAQQGDFVVIDEYDRVMVMRPDRFENQYMENPHAEEPQLQRRRTS